MRSLAVARPGAERLYEYVIGVTLSLRAILWSGFLTPACTEVMKEKKGG